MNFYLLLFERLSEVSTTALHVYFLYRIMDTKVSPKKQLTMAALFLCARMVNYIFGTGYRPFFEALSIIIYASLVFVGNMKAYTVWTIILVVLDGTVDAVIISLYLLLPNAAIMQIGNPGFVRMITTVVSKGVLFAVYNLITRKVDKAYNVQQRNFTPLLIVPAGCWIILEIVFKSIDALPLNMSQLLLSAGCVVLLLIVASTIYLCNCITADGKDLAQSKLKLRISEMTNNHIDQLNDVYTELSTIRHDLKNHFAAISGFLSVKDYPALEQYVTELAGFEMAMQEYIKHPVLDALISLKVSLANNTNIDFTVNLSLPEELPMTDVDLCILMSNLLDNAFDANANAAESQYINLYAHIVNSYWVIVCRNSTNKQVCFRSTGSLMSTKADAGIHGIGTKQIQKIVEKCGGFVTYRQENCEFTTVVTIKLSS